MDRTTLRKSDIGLIFLFLGGAFPRDFPAVILPAIIGAALTFWALNDSRAARAAGA